MKKIRIRYRLTALALALAFASTGVQALVIDAIVTGGTTLLSGNKRSVQDNSGGPDSNYRAVNSSISRFDSSNGVLMGVNATLTPGNTSTFLRADGNTGGIASVEAIWSGTTGTGLNKTEQLNLVTRNGGDGSTDSGDNSWAPLSQTITNGSNLNSWVGTGNLNTTVTTTLTADRTSSSGTFQARIGDSAANNDNDLKNLTASYSVEYQYLQHAAPSFDGNSTLTELTLNFGEVYQGDLVSEIGFSLFNLTGDRVGLDLDFFSGSGDTSILTTDLTTFAGLGAGENNDFHVAFDTTELGSFSATYVLDLSDADVGASSSRYAFNDYLTLNLTGTVVEQPVLAAAVAIPEPGMLALISAGLFGLLGLSRSRRF